MDGSTNACVSQHRCYQQHTKSPSHWETDVFFYSTAIRCGELASLEVYDIETDRRIIKIRQGKGAKDRVVPIGQRALGWIEKYIRDIRPALLVNPHETTLFLTAEGEPLSTNYASQIVRDYVDEANIGKSGSCHLFRHTMATLMLENGADIRFIQAMLGHASINTTQIYTQVSIRKLKEIHEATHPAKDRREKNSEDESPAKKPSDDDQATTDGSSQDQRSKNSCSSFL